MLKTVAEHLVDVHGQHDHQYLLKPANQVEVLDQFAGLDELRRKYRAVYDELADALARLDELAASGTLRQQQLELYRFQADEIDKAELSEGEYEELSARASVLSNLEKIRKDSGAAYAALYEADGSIVERLKMMSAILAELTDLDSSLKAVSGAVKDATLSLEEAAFDLSRYLDRLELDPAELAEVNDRLNTLNRLANKYGDPIGVTLAYRADIAGKIAELEKQTDDLSSLSNKLDPLRRQLESLGNDLSARRKSAARELTPGIERALADLGMERAKFNVAITPASAALPGVKLPATPSGFDAVEFLAQTNPGMAPAPLRKIASGGELSRIMLALKGILAGSDRVSVLVFDEVDANVGGRLGAVIGNKLRSLAQSHQVLCITHLPQIACYADRHLTVRKSVTGDTTQTVVRKMEGEERLAEIAEMIGGQHVTDTTRAQARELLETAQREFAAPIVASVVKAPAKSKARRVSA